MTNLAFEAAAEPRRFSQLKRLLGHRVDSEWSVADWMIGLASVTLALGSASFFGVSYAISVSSPDFFQNAALANIPPKLDRLQTGSIDTGNAMPAPQIVRSRALQPSDYQIVMVFRDEALLATHDELVRVKVGSLVPGLGVIRTIDAAASGSTVVADLATLRGVTPSRP
ncbi:hypothetical protein [Aureimonas pseudogalii]|uniref:Uncharacterized protein n=1 Tax=Aureimonas pseudogalii TaxID=1744844 RepID=A0A7W6E7K3_9HYPH|nr:hypothetical protein [Aureimonas pseudogalii]MBB3996201.1 hypothetical protein [Aureimonas pseudogalii]